MHHWGETPGVLIGNMKRQILPLLAAVTALVLLGVLMLNSASIVEEVPRRVHSHFIWLMIGVFGAVGLALIDYRLLQRFHLPRLLLFCSGVLLLALLIPGVGVLVNGARRWLPFGGQPSEVAKIALIIWLADYGARQRGRMGPISIGFLRPAMLCGVVSGLIFLEPDWGTAALLAAVSWAMLLMAGTRWRYLLSTLAIGTPVFALLVAFNPVRIWRVLSFTDPERYQDGIGWQGWHSVLSIGAGGIWGSFCGEGAHKFGFVPEQQTDFVFSLIGEELGLIGTTLVVLLFGMVTLNGIRIAWRITDSFGQLLVSGLTLLISTQAFINLGVCTSTLPNKGIPLPFVSYGGSSLVCTLMAVGMIVSVARRAPTGPVYSGLNRQAPQSNPFRTAPLRPHTTAAVGLASLLLRRKPKLLSRIVTWVSDFRSARRPPVAIKSYQRPPSVPAR